MARKWAVIEVWIRPGMSPTELAVADTFCHESFVVDGKHIASRCISPIALPHTHRHVHARRWRVKNLKSCWVVRRKL